MFGTMGISELIIILVIVLIIFGAGRLPQIGEGVGKALKGFKKEVHDVPQPTAAQVDAAPPPVQAPPDADAPAQPVAGNTAPAIPKPNVPYTPGPEMTPGTTASLLYQAGPQTSQGARTAPRRDPSSVPAPTQPAVTMEERDAAPSPVVRAQYPPLPAAAQARPSAKRPSAIVNKDAVARVQAQQAALKAKAAPSGAGVSPKDMQTVGEGLGGLVRSFQQAVADVRSSVDPEMHTIQTEIDAAQKEIQQSLDAAKETPAIQEDFPKPA
jgi:TatA/E family protein of Tat protein translocase